MLFPAFFGQFEVEAWGTNSIYAPRWIEPEFE
jgi:hypothetical protein